jgi:hypothetical protein
LDRQLWCECVHLFDEQSVNQFFLNIYFLPFSSMRLHVHKLLLGTNSSQPAAAAALALSGVAAHENGVGPK